MLLRNAVLLHQFIMCPGDDGYNSIKAQPHIDCPCGNLSCWLGLITKSEKVLRNFYRTGHHTFSRNNIYCICGISQKSHKHPAHKVFIGVLRDNPRPSDPSVVYIQSRTHLNGSARATIFPIIICLMFNVSETERFIIAGCKMRRRWWIHRNQFGTISII